MLKIFSRLRSNLSLHSNASPDNRIGGWLLTRREFDREVASERARTVRRRIPFCVLQIALQGEDQNKRQLRELGKLVRRSVRMTDEKGLTGKFTIGLLLVDTPEMGGRTVLDRLQRLTEIAKLHVSISLSVFDPEAFDQNDDDHRGSSPESRLVRLSDSESLRPLEPSFAESSSILKRAVDILVASIGLIGAAPVILALAYLVRRDGGPAFFVQLREGRGGRVFRMYKLRTMIVNAEALQDSLRDQSERDGPAFKITRDPRVTRTGNFLRSTCLDELPQLWNVLIGDMSLVGPRPLPVGESRACKPWHRRRLDVRPGITCSWQIDKESAQTFDDWMRMDLNYVDSRSVIQDLRLIFQTFSVPLRARGSR